MARDLKKYLYDMQRAVDLVVQFTRDVSFDAYQNDPLLRSAVERRLGIAGEALAQLSKIAPSLAAKIPNSRAVIAFRNILVHGYADVDQRLVWGVIESRLMPLRAVLQTLLRGGA